MKTQHLTLALLLLATSAWAAASAKPAPVKASSSKSAPSDKKSTAAKLDSATAEKSAITANRSIEEQLAKPLPEIAIPKSTFLVDAKTSRNPFFPQSSTKKPDTKSSKPALDLASAIVLNGLTSPPKRTAMINGKTFEEGEAGDIKLGNGSRITIQCVEIRADGAVIAVNGQKRELRLRRGI